MLLSLERVRNREKERSDMMKIGNGTLIQIYNSKYVEGTMQLFIITIHIRVLVR